MSCGILFKVVEPEVVVKIGFYWEMKAPQL